MFILIWILLVGRIIALILAADVIYRQLQLRERNIEPRLRRFRDLSFSGALGVFTLNIFPLMVNVLYLLSKDLKPFMSDPIGASYAVSFMLLSLGIAYVTNEIYSKSDSTESLATLVKRKIGIK